MGSVNISVKDEAYKFLKSLKSKNESFSDVILHFKEKKKGEGVMRFFGTLKDVHWDKRQKHMKELKESFNERL